ncbi:MAG TPA: protein kinase [Bryobacteraceae bacterium]|nr:protein kinase [Bryobacteraceae bacterium]
MRFQPGERLGPYQIVAVLGAGGMGEVYRAKDVRLGRDVAIKVLAPHLVEDASFRMRLAHEAQAAARLSHPNTVAVYDVGEDYIVSEYVEGVTLRKIASPPIRQILEIGAQAAAGLAAAHAMGIVHRDIKPENIMLTAQGRVKILDFGLAKPIAAAAAPDGPVALTQPGMVIGTLSYMSPEQVRGSAVDHRSDIFSLGLVLHEMLTGRKVFESESGAEVMSAILKDDPPPLPPQVPPALAFVVLRCLEKAPEARFQSAQDLGLSLSAMAAASQSAAPVVEPPPRKAPTRRFVLTGALTGVAGALGVFAGYLLFRRNPPSFRQVTFQRGFVSAGRFGQKGDEIVYSLFPDAESSDVFLTGVASPESRGLGMRNARLFSISVRNELAVALDCRYIGDNSQVGTLAVAPLYGGAPRTVMPGVSEADWDPAGKQLAIVRNAEGWCRLEYPPGKVLYRSAGWIGDLRFSPLGGQIAFSDHRKRNYDTGRVVVVDLDGKVQRVSGNWESIEGLAWSRDGREIWFAAAHSDYADSVYAIAPGSGELRLVARFPVSMKLEDLDRNGRLLFSTFDSDSYESRVRQAGSEREQYLDWLGSGYPADLSDDGKLLLFSRYGQAAGSRYGVYIRKLAEAPPVRLGDGDALALSPNAAYALALQESEPERLAVLQYHVDSPQVLAGPGLEYQPAGQWFPDSRRIIFEANEAGRGTRIWLQEIPMGKPQAITPEGVSLEGAGLAPDGSAVVARSPDGALRLYPTAGGQVREIPGLLPGDRPVRWTGEGNKLIVVTGSRGAARLDEVDITTGVRAPVQELSDPNPLGVVEISQVLASADGKTLLYSQSRRIRTLRLAEGLR